MNDHFPTKHSQPPENSLHDSELKSANTEFGKKFEEDGLTMELAREKAILYKKLHESSVNGQVDGQTGQELWHSKISMDDPDLEKKEREYHLNCFYLNTSDAIFPLDRAKVEQGHILTIAASGDAGQLFLLNGAKKLEMCDISLPGVLYNELKLIGLRNLNLLDYRKMFDVRRTGPWIDSEIYSRLRPQLSAQARCFFDLLIDHPNPKAETLKNEHWDKNFIKTREAMPLGDGLSGENPFPQTVGSIVDYVGDGFMHMDYKKLQQNAQKADVSIRWRDINDYGTKHELNASVIYLSNLGYDPADTAEVAKIFLKRGAKRVIFSMDSSRSIAQEIEPGIVKLYRYKWSVPQTGDMRKHLPPPPDEIPNQIVINRTADNDQETRWKLEDRPYIFDINGLRAKLLGLDSRFEFNLILEANENDNQPR